MKGGSDDKSKCTVQAKPGRNGKVVFANLSRLGILLPMTISLLVFDANRVLFPGFKKFSESEF